MRVEREFIYTPYQETLAKFTAWRDGKDTFWLIIENPNRGIMIGHASSVGDHNTVRAKNAMSHYSQNGAYIVGIEPGIGYYDAVNAAAANAYQWFMDHITMGEVRPAKVTALPGKPVVKVRITPRHVIVNYNKQTWEIISDNNRRTLKYRKNWELFEYETMRVHYHDKIDAEVLNEWARTMEGI